MARRTILNNSGADPIRKDMKIVNPDGTPTDAFLRNWQRQRASNSGTATNIDEAIALVNALSAKVIGVTAPITGGGALGAAASERYDYTAADASLQESFMLAQRLGLVDIAALGVLMAVAHRAEGWPLAYFLIKAEGGVAIGIHAALALVLVGLGGSYAKRGFSHWRGSLAGGASGAVISALISAENPSSKVRCSARLSALRRTSVGHGAFDMVISFF